MVYSRYTSRIHIIKDGSLGILVGYRYNKEWFTLGMLTG